MSPLRATDALLALLGGLPERLPLSRIDRVWIFPPKELGSTESGLVVLSLVPEDPAERSRREVVTARYELEKGRKGSAPTPVVTEQGLAPPDRIPRIIEGVLARGGDSEDPVEAAIDGDVDRWNAVLAALFSGPR